ncbi:hypothetical protein GQ44DRAFT_828880 [Phaeosphaeriaceae sp. PMI808]|nr:hypothetical protein GQ44DRAFT_828880 [Phaeosphaeriaceae sp. PMI808]
MGPYEGETREEALRQLVEDVEQQLEGQLQSLEKLVETETESQDAGKENHICEMVSSEQNKTHADHDREETVSQTKDDPGDKVEPAKPTRSKERVMARKAPRLQKSEDKQHKAVDTSRTLRPRSNTDKKADSRQGKNPIAQEERGGPESPQNKSGPELTSPKRKLEDESGLAAEKVPVKRLKHGKNMGKGAE